MLKVSLSGTADAACCLVGQQRTAPQVIRALHINSIMCDFSPDASADTVAGSNSNSGLDVQSQSCVTCTPGDVRGGTPVPTPLTQHRSARGTQTKGHASSAGHGEGSTSLACSGCLRLVVSGQSWGSACLSSVQLVTKASFLHVCFTLCKACMRIVKGAAHMH